MAGESLDDEIGVPDNARLTTKNPAKLSTPSGVSILVNQESCNRKEQGRSLLVGRQAATADIRIQHGSISRKHASLFYLSDNNRLYVKDLGGKHGITVNGQRMASNETLWLKHGDAILFGNVRESVFTVQRESDEESERDSTKDTSAISSEQMSAAVVPNHSDHDRLEKAGEGLSGRAKRQAEIAAMMASLDETPTYTAPPPPTIHEQVDNTTTQNRQDSTKSSSMLKALKKHKLPVSEHLTLKHDGPRRNQITCLAIDQSGSRFVVGGMDMKLSFYDFGGMDRVRHDSFRTVIPEDGHVLVDCCYSNTGDRILVGTGGVQPIILDRDGEELLKFVRGDMYVSDPSKTKGHTAAITSVDWHPLEKDTVLTGSIDGSARLWNLNGKTQFKMLVTDKTFVVKNVRGHKTAVTCVCFHPGGREFCVGTSDGSIQVWNRTRVVSRPERAIWAAHGEGRPVTALAYNMDGSRLASRSAEDGRVKIWDVQRLSRSSSPLVTCAGLGTVHEASNMAFSPDGNVLCAGTSEYQKVGEQRQELGSLCLFDVSGSKDTVQPLVSIDMNTNVGPVAIQWHSRLNQIFVGCSNGETLVFYDERHSSKGAVSVAGKTVRTNDGLSDLLQSRARVNGNIPASNTIVNPFALPMYRDEKVDPKKKAREARKDPVKSREPERPASGKHKVGGQGGGNVTFQQFVAEQTMATTKNAIAGKDPREALFKYNEGTTFTEKSFAGSKRILADRTAEEDVEEHASKRPR